jgi:malonyl-ACP decarboxylase
MDSNLCGICTESFNIGGFAYTLGGSSASGLLAIIKAVQAIQAGEVDVCLAMGALMDLSYWECQGFKSLGAMGTDRYAMEPELAARPFDQDRDGFIYGESCGVLVLEKASVTKRNGVNPYARISGWAIKMDGNRYPNPSYEGQVCTIMRTLKMADLNGKQIDYINPHGTGSIIGDKIELQALRNCGLNHACINATKSITGHGLSAAGAVEVIATILQMKMGQLHPTRNLDRPIDMSFNWVCKNSLHHMIEKALNISIGFGGINTALCLERL